MKRQLHTREAGSGWLGPVFADGETVNPKLSQPCMPKPHSPILDPKPMNPAHTQPRHNSHTTCPCPPGCLCRDTRSARWPSDVYKYGLFPSPSSWRPVALSSSKPSPRFSNLAKMLGCWPVYHLDQDVLDHCLPRRYHLPVSLVSSPP